MGAKLALEAFAFANIVRLKPVPRALLVYMALRALDFDSADGKPSRRSFMRRSELGKAIGREMPESEPLASALPIERAKWDADDQAVARAIRSLKATGAIREIGSARTGRTSVYLIALSVERDAKHISLDRADTAKPSQNVVHRKSGSIALPASNNETLGTSFNEQSGVRFVLDQGDAHRIPKEPATNHEETREGLDAKAAGRIKIAELPDLVIPSVELNKMQRDALDSWGLGAPSSMEVA